jgi:PqqD family protein of HPr-rel-A system
LAHSSLRERRFGGESVFFDGYSGETHYLDGLAGAIMRRVSDGAAVDLQSLCAEFVGPSRQERDVTITLEAVRETALTLRRIGLLRIDDGL